MFNLEQAIKQWRRKLRSNPAFEDGDVAELESHLREEVEKLKVEGLSDEEAFNRAVEEIGEPKPIGDELYKSRSTQKAGPVPSWKQKSWVPSLLPNYLKVALRNMKRDPVNSFINVFGLTMGLVCAIVIFLFVRHESSYDTFHEKADRVFRVTNEFIRGTGPRHYATTAPAVGPAMKRDFPEIEQAIRFRDLDPNLVHYEDRVFLEDGIFFVDDGFFELFSFPLAAGNMEMALSEPGTVVITPQMARKYFGEENPMGRQILIDYRDNPLELTVTGVLEPIPNNTHFEFSFLISFETFEVPDHYPVTLESWGWVSFYTYVLLDEQADPQAVEDKFPFFIRTHREPERAERTSYFLQPLTQVYFNNSTLINSPGPMKAGSRQILYGLSAVGIFLLLIACFNFMNLSTARSIRRAKEAGMRKVCGAYKSHLAGQFLGESLLVSFLSLGIALLGLNYTIDLLNAMFALDIAFSWSDYWGILPIFIAITLISGLIGGSYPAFIISTFRPAEALKGEIKKGGKIVIRKTLVITQFALAVILIIGSLVVVQQMHYIQNRELGFNKEQVLVIDLLNDETRGQYDILKEQLLARSDVVAVSGASSDEMFDNTQNSLPMFPEGVVNEEDAYPMDVYTVHYDFFETMDIDIVEGRAFSREMASDSARAIIVNKAAVRTFGWDEPVGEYLRIFELKEGNVIGVVEDFHYASLHEEIQPLVIELGLTFPPDKIFARLQTEDLQRTLASIGEQFGETVATAPFNYTFLDEHLNELYRPEMQFSQLVTLFTIVTFIIACMGLYGLVSFVIARRTKEIGIRKVLGSTASQIVRLLSKEFVGNVVIANLIAWPVAWWITRTWLQNFAYRIDISVWVFVVSALVTIILAWITMSWQSVRAALMNPVNSLRSE